jgi:hypothetical protein
MRPLPNTWLNPRLQSCPTITVALADPGAVDPPIRMRAWMAADVPAVESWLGQ